MKPRDLLGHGCKIDHGCTQTADYLVVDGDVTQLVCTRHLLDAIEDAALDSDLNVDGEPLQVYAMRELS